MYFKTADVESIKIFYCRPVSRRNRLSFFCTVLPPPRISSTNSFRVWQIAFMSLRRTTPAWGTARCRIRLSCSRRSMI